jgi:hypothetical protein
LIRGAKKPEGGFSRLKPVEPRHQTASLVQGPLLVQAAAFILMLRKLRATLEKFSELGNQAA